MYALRLHIRPTSGLTFRRVPFSTREMLTYPFVPPTTLSGFVARLLRLAHGEELPEASNAKPEFVVLPREFHVLGALPPFAATRKRFQYTIHSAVRQGVRRFDHAAFSHIWRPKDKFTYQLYRWEYLFTDILTGYIAHEDEATLATLRVVNGWGCKFGKEGWAFVENVDGPFLLQPEHARYLPATLVPVTDIFAASAAFYPLYRYAWADEVGQGGQIAIQGFTPLLAALVNGEVEMDYLSGAGAHIPVTMLEYF